jgi:hypothetical protein
VAGCSWGGGIDAWTISWTSDPPDPVNQKPEPIAPDDIEIMLGEEVLLDGRNSTDAENAPTGDTSGNDLIYEWNLTLVPQASSVNDASLQPNDTVATPTFVPDVPGRYRITLAVYDGELWSNLSDEDNVDVIVIKPNDPPVPDAGPDLSGYEGDTFILDGSDSFDPDGTIIYFDWSCTSHSITFDDQGTDHPSFTPPQPGEYLISLRVRDDNETWSDISDTMKATAIEVGMNVPPVANAGKDQSAIVGSTVVLNGSSSLDRDGEIVTWEWSCITHEVDLFDRNSSSPYFIPDSPGTYIFELRVKDDNGTWSNPDSVEITTEEPYFNDRPVSNAGSDREAYVGDRIILDGSGSYDTNGWITEYNWTCTSHAVSLTDGTGATPSFLPGEPGNYVFTLAVSDNEGAWSVADEVTVFVLQLPIVTFDITIGPFLFENGTPVDGGIVVLSDISGELESRSIDPDGFVSFGSLIPGNYYFELHLDGRIVIGPLSIILTDDGTTTYPNGEIPKLEIPDPDPNKDDDGDDDETPDGDEEGGIIVLVIVMITVILLIMATVLIVGFFIIKGRKKNTDDPEEEDTKDCPVCGLEMEYRPDFERYYCEKCGRYR